MKGPMKSVAVATLVTMLASRDASALDCANAITTPDINECVAIEKDKVEVKLNETYQRVLAFLDNSDPLIKEDAAKAKMKLKEAQRAWITFREADCDAVYAYNASGTIRTVMWIGCMQTHAEQRIAELNSFMEGGG